MLNAAMASRNNLVRKSAAYLNQIPRQVRRAQAASSSYRDHPPILVNSVPKSGTHLLLQLGRALPGIKYYGSVCGQRPSVTMRTRSTREILGLLNKAVPGEVIAGHVYFDETVASWLEERSFVHLFIYRDPRDVVLSEAHYLTTMNRLHRLHRYMKKLPDMEARVAALIEGIPGIYEDIGTRLRYYAGWLDRPEHVLSVRYEDLAGSEQVQCVRTMAEWLIGRVPHLKSENIDALSHRLQKSIAPERSHTFRSGGSEKWRTQMSEANRQRIEHHAGDVIAKLGYVLQ